MILVEQKLFTKDECETIISYNNAQITNWKMNDRKYNSQSIDYSSETSWIFNKLKTFFEEITNIEVYNIKKQIHFHKFIKGDWFSKHNDVRDSRHYAVGVLLNDNFKGGDFKLYNTDDVILNKIVGNAYIFDVRIDHEIIPILEGERYSLLWFLQTNNLRYPKTSLI